MPETTTYAIVPPQLQEAMKDLGFQFTRCPEGPEDYVHVTFPPRTHQAHATSPGKDGVRATLWQIPQGNVLIRWKPSEGKPHRSLRFFPLAQLKETFPSGISGVPDAFYERRSMRPA